MNSLACQHNCPSKYLPSCAICHVRCVLSCLLNIWHTCNWVLSSKTALQSRGSLVLLQVYASTFFFESCINYWCIGASLSMPHTSVVNWRRRFNRPTMSAQSRVCLILYRYDNTQTHDRLHMRASTQVVKYNLSYRKWRRGIFRPNRSVLLPHISAHVSIKGEIWQGETFLLAPP